MLNAFESDTEYVVVRLYIIILFKYQLLHSLFAIIGFQIYLITVFMFHLKIKKMRQFAHNT